MSKKWLLKDSLKNQLEKCLNLNSVFLFPDHNWLTIACCSVELIRDYQETACFLFS